MSQNFNNIWKSYSKYDYSLPKNSKIDNLSVSSSLDQM